MRVLYISSTEIPSPAANTIQIIRMCQAMANIGHTVTLLNLNQFYKRSQNDPNWHDYYGVEHDTSLKLETLPIKAINGKVSYLFSTILTLPKLLYFIKTISPDVVYGRYLPGCLLASLAGKRVIFESHYPVWSSLLQRLLFSLLLQTSNFKRLILITNALSERYIAKYPNIITQKRILVLPDAANPVKSEVIKSPLLGRPGTLQAGYVGHLYQGKGMEIIASLAQRLPETDFHIIGGLESDILTWKEKITTSNVKFHGFIPPQRLSPFINALDICLLPNQIKTYSYNTGNSNNKDIGKYTSPLKLFEYMAHKKPIIASDIPVLREVLDSNCAILVPPSDIDAWEHAVKSLECFERRTRLGTAGYNKFLENYTWTIRAQKALDKI